MWAMCLISALHPVFYGMDLLSALRQKSVLILRQFQQKVERVKSECNKGNGGESRRRMSMIEEEQKQEKASHLCPRCPASV